LLLVIVNTAGSGSGISGSNSSVG